RRQANRARRDRPRPGPRRAHRRRAGAPGRPRPRPSPARRLRDGGELSTFILLTVTGLGLGAVYFLIASGLSLIYGLMGVLNFAHGAFLTVGAYSSWYIEGKLSGVDSLWLRFILAAVCGLAI